MEWWAFLHETRGRIEIVWKVIRHLQGFPTPSELDLAVHIRRKFSTQPEDYEPVQQIATNLP